MTDEKTLLEAAARAAGIRLAVLGETSNAPARIWDRGGLLTVLFYNDHRDHPMCRKPNRPGNVPWNPLTDDGDALRLAAKLGFSVHVHPLSIGVSQYGKGCYLGGWMDRGLDDVDDYRRAIVRAAASIPPKEPT